MGKTKAAESQKQAEFADLTHFELDGEMIRALPEDFCRDHLVVLLGRRPTSQREIVPLGMLNTGMDGVIALAEKKTHWKLRTVQLNAFELDQALDFGFAGEGGAETAPSIHVTSVREQLRLSTENCIEFGRDQSAPKIVIDTLSEAVRRRASDVHIEVYDDDVDLRFRIDGVLHQVHTPMSLRNIRKVVSYIKVLARLDIANRMTPQDGRLETLYTDTDGAARRVDLRVATMPGPVAEDVTLRILDKTHIQIGLDDLGMTPELLARFSALVHSPGGIVLVTGPTASGKTTTLYASLRTINTHENKIITVEDPIEFRLERVCQKQVGPNMSFADYTRAFMRQNPDILMIGEVRDEETAQLALRAAQMGHLVLTTLHTRDAPSSLIRLTHLGGDRSVVLSSLLGVLSQRLVRRVCQKCAESYQPDEETLARLPKLPDGMTFTRGAGCDACDDTGYRGQVGVYELLAFDGALRRKLSQGTLADSIAELGALEFGRMIDDAIAKAAAGLTTVEEVLRAVPVPD